MKPSRDSEIDKPEPAQRFVDEILRQYQQRAVTGKGWEPPEKGLRVSTKLLIALLADRMVGGYQRSLERQFTLLSLLKNSRIHRPPGGRSARLLRTIFGDKAADSVFDSQIADLQHEYFDLLDRGLKWQARFALARGYLGLAAAVLRYLRVYVLLEKILKITKATGGS